MKKQFMAFVNADCSDFSPASYLGYKEELKVFGPNTKIKVTFEHYYRQRTLSQNGVLHWYCDELAQECGMKPGDFKEMMKMKFLKRLAVTDTGEYIVDPDTGELLTFIPSTSDLNTAEMVKFTEEIRLWGLEFLNYELPLPDKNHKIKFFENTKKQLQNGTKNQ